MLNEALRLVRVFHDLNKAETATKVGFSKSYITELERGDKNVSLEVLNRYATSFNIPLSSLMFFAEHAAEGGMADAARARIAAKVVKMLNWVSEITAEDEGGGAEENSKASPAQSKRPISGHVANKIG